MDPERTSKGACRVCGRPATTLVNWSILACGGCKVFYRRAVKNKISYMCKGSGNCPTKVEINQTRCRACRLKKCVDVGMCVREDRAANRKESPSNTQLASTNYHSNYPSPTPSTGSDVASGSSGNVNYQSFAHSEPYYNVSADNSHNFHHSALRPAKPDRALFLDSALPPWCAKAEDCDEEVFQDIRNLADGTAEFVKDENRALTAVAGLQPMDLVGNVRRFTQQGFAVHPIATVNIPLISRIMESRYMENQDEDSIRQQIMATAYAVGNVADHVFGDQIICWTQAMEHAVQGGKVVRQPETSIEEMVAALNHHSGDNIKRSIKFASMLPGMDQLQPADKVCVTAGWKWLIYAMIHHSPFFSHTESYFTVGPQQYQYCRYWQELITEWPLMVSIYKLCNQFREIGLDQWERYLVLAVVMLEPDEKNSATQSAQLRQLHRHYLDVLLNTVTRRCSDTAQFTAMCRKLESFFGMFEVVFRIHDYYYNSHRHECPPCSVVAKDYVLQLQKKSARCEDLSVADSELS